MEYTVESAGKELARMCQNIDEFAKKGHKVETKSALFYALEKHKSQYRDGGKIPYMIHPLTMACHALSLGIYEDVILAAILLHDVCEDCGVEIEELPFSTAVRQLVDAMTFSVAAEETKQQAKERYFKHISENPKAAFIKMLDRCNNVSTMTSGFSTERMKRYIQETREFILPLKEVVSKGELPLAEKAFALSYHIESVISSIEALIK